MKSWLNVVAPLDAVTAGRGLTFLFPAAHDIRVHLPLLEHGADVYLRQPKVSLAVGEALFGSLSRDVARPETSVEVALTNSEGVATFALAFAHMTLNEMKRIASDRAPRYEQALGLVQLAVTESLIQVAAEQGRNVSNQIFDLESGRPPACPRMWTVDEAIRLLVITATTNLVSPWEIESHESARAALPLASVGLGFGAQQGSKVSDAITDARNALGLDPDDVWARLLLGAAGVALVVAAPVGLALAVPAGLAGAAAVTSALAAFGPGGMVGGMALAGTLIGTGAVTTASAALADAPKPVLEVEVLRRTAHARARQLLGLQQDPFDWLLLTTLEGEVASELGRLSSFSDENAVSVKMLIEKTKLLRKAIEWMLDQGLGQRVVEREPD